MKRTTLQVAAAIIVPALLLTGCGWFVRRATIAYIALYSQLTPSRIEMQIDNSFIAQYRNRVTIHTAMLVDKAMSNPVGGALDGDLHFAGRAPQVELPLVAEIANASAEPNAVKLVHDAEGTSVPLRVSGVWRIWSEHPGSSPEKQGAPLPAFTSYKPDHVFEIHPITKIGKMWLLGTFIPVKGFSPGGAQRTFGIFEAAPCTLSVKPKSVSIVTSTGLYNDVEFIMAISSEPQRKVADGRFVIASALDMGGHVLVNRLRMVFAKDSPPERAVRLLKSGDHLHVYGIPRIDFDEIWRRVKFSQSDPKLLTLPLPYEIVILGVYPN